MFINCKLLFSAVLLLSLIVPVFSFEPSGGVLVLDGKDDYAILHLAEHGYIFPKNTHAFTTEIWFYPKSEPQAEENHIILSQQVLFGLTGRCGFKLNKNQLCCSGSAQLEGKVRGVLGVKVAVEKNQWNYVAIVYKDRKLGFAYNNQFFRTQEMVLMNRVAAELRLVEEWKNFFVGGFHEDWFIIRDGKVLSQRTYFGGEIDAIRFSNIARYNLPAGLKTEPFDPPHRFFSDEHTIALWNFDEKAGANRFQDASGSGKTLIGMNGVTTSGALAVNPADTSITMTWGQIKSESF